MPKLESNRGEFGIQFYRDWLSGHSSTLLAWIWPHCAKTSHHVHRILERFSCLHRFKEFIFCSFNFTVLEPYPLTRVFVRPVIARC